MMSSDSLVASESLTVSSVKRSIQEIKEDELDPKKIRLSEESETTGDSVAAEPFVRVKTKKMAILLSYSGKDYFGLQRNTDVPTIEGDVLKAMLDIKIITEDQHKVPQALNFQRAARTDKGVSATKQVLSCRLPVECDSLDTVQQINKLLPPQIRIMSIKKSTNGFNSKNNCDGRTYAYITPSFAFASVEDSVSEDYRIAASQIAEVNAFLALYKGSHNFHNFTSGRKPTDPSNNRYILYFECGDPFMSGGLEFVRLRVRGQSFMMHQIRKMIALAIAKMRGLANEETLKKAWDKEKVDLPKAPGLGLMLEEVHYDSYNKRYGADGIHEPLLWEEFADEIKEFTEKHIFPAIVETEKSEKSMLNWMSTLTLNSYDTFDPTSNHRNHPGRIKDQLKTPVCNQELKEEQQDMPLDYSGRTQKNLKNEPCLKEEPPVIG